MSQDKPFHPIHRLKGRGGEYYYLIAREARRLKPKHPVLVLGVLISCAVSLIFSRPTQAGNETLTLETYYPAPYGIYNEFTTTGQTILATESGNVGIGTTTPADKLDIEDTKNDAVTVSIRNTQTGDSAESRIYLKGASGEGGGTFTYYNKDYSIAGRSHLADRVAVIGDSLTGGLTLLSTAPSSDMRFFTGGDQAANERMRITVTGNVGIGTTEPGTALDLNGAFSLRQMAAPGLRPLNQRRLYFDSASKKFKVSENGAAYVDLTAGGGAMGYEQVSNTCSSKTCSAPCPAGKKILGGGCSFTASIFLSNSYPSSNSWQCAYSGLGAGWSTAYAICANIQ